jgi:membrane peptidoglycan carboxypeptidase
MGSTEHTDPPRDEPPGDPDGPEPTGPEPTGPDPDGLEPPAAARDDAPRRRPWRSLGIFLGVSVLAGVLLAGFALPVLGSGALVVKAASDHFEDLPDDFQEPSLPQRTNILAADGSVLAQTWGDYGNRVVVPLTQVNPNMPNALIAIEDSRYYQHGGIDLTGTVRAFFRDAQGASTQGGSTIAQQYVKNVLLLEAGQNKALQQQAVADTIARKITELRYAVSVEKQMSKRKILENYLNLVYFGNDAYGVQAAAQKYFSTTAAQLTAPQAALLAAIVNSPSYYDPFAHPDAALARRNLVLQKMADPDLDYLTPQQAAAAEATPLGLHPTASNSGCIAAVSAASFFCNYVYTTFLNDPDYGATVQDREAMWEEGGLTVTTTLDPVAQNAAAKAISQHTYPTDKVASAIAMVEPGTGRITAMAQSRPMGNGPGQTFVNLAADPGHNGTLGYQAGSSFKIFTGLAALNQGIDPSLPIDSPSPLVSFGGTQIAACTGGANAITWPLNYQPNNDDMADHVVPMDQAFWFSVNTYFLTLETQTGLCAPATLAQSMGVTKDNDVGVGKPLDQYASFTLGTNQITPIEMAAAYATVADQGTYCVPYVITAVSDINRKQYKGQAHSCKQVLSPNVANELTSMLQGVLTQPGATASGLGLADGREAAGKTGTTDSSVATWFDGYTPQLAAAVWTGFADAGKKGESMSGMTIGGQYYGGQIFGATISAPIWQQAMNGALANQPPIPFAAPTGFPTDQPSAPPSAPPTSAAALPPGTTPIIVLPRAGTRRAPAPAPAPAPMPSPPAPNGHARH